MPIAMARYHQTQTPRAFQLLFPYSACYPMYLVHNNEEIYYFY